MERDTCCDTCSIGNTCGKGIDCIKLHLTASNWSCMKQLHQTAACKSCCMEQLQLHATAVTCQSCFINLSTCNSMTCLIDT